MMNKAFRERMEAAVDFLKKEVPEVSFIKPMGAFYLFVDISSVKDALLATADADGRMPQSGTDSYAMEFTMKLLNEKHVAIAPGTAFGKGRLHKDPHMRQIRRPCSKVLRVYAT